jgi:hypothetical protein
MWGKVGVVVMANVRSPVGTALRKELAGRENER